MIQCNCETINGDATIKPVNNVIYWSIGDYNYHIDRESMKNTLKFAFDVIEGLVGLKFREGGTSHITVNFTEDVPVPFDHNDMAYAIAPGHSLSGNVYFNPSYEWSINGEGQGVSTYKVMIHEILHTLNVGHVDDPSCIMYGFYNTEPIAFCSETKEASYKLYKKYITGVGSILVKYRQLVQGLDESYIDVFMRYFSLEASGSKDNKLDSLYSHLLA